MRLSNATIGQIPKSVERFSYDRDAQAVGIIHFGIGAFHRAHQAWYTDLAMDQGDRDWAIAGISMRSASVASQLVPQDGLYTVAARSGKDMDLRVCGAVQTAIVATQQPERVIDLIAAPATRIVSFTVTEKGYCRTPDGSLDHRLAGKGSFYPLLAAGLQRRQEAGLSGITLMSCDNLAANGPQLRRLLGEYVSQVNPDLASWIAEACTFPSTMVDRIVPATTDADRDDVEAGIGLRDEAVVMTEPFSQWVIEDYFAQGRPCWDKVGAQLVSDVAPYETAKLRMLNGAHSALAHLGLSRGYDYVHEAVADPAILPVIENLMRDEAATSFTAAMGQDLSAYADALLARFRNSALRHKLSQIAMDGSQKIPQRWLETLVYHQRRGRECPSILAALSAWLRHVRGDNGAVDDPLAARLAEAWTKAGKSGILHAVFATGGVLPGHWSPTTEDAEAIGLLLEDRSRSERNNARSF